MSGPTKTERQSEEFMLMELLLYSLLSLVGMRLFFRRLLFYSRTRLFFSLVNIILREVVKRASIDSRLGYFDRLSRMVPHPLNVVKDSSLFSTTHIPAYHGVTKHQFR